MASRDAVGYGPRAGWSRWLRRLFAVLVLHVRCTRSDFDGVDTTMFDALQGPRHGGRLAMSFAQARAHLCHRHSCPSIVLETFWSDGGRCRTGPAGSAPGRTWDGRTDVRVVATARIHRASYSAAATWSSQETTSPCSSASWMATWAMNRSGPSNSTTASPATCKLDYQAMELSADPGHTLVTFTAAPDTPAAEALAFLTSWTTTPAPQSHALDQRAPIGIEEFDLAALVDEPVENQGLTTCRRRTDQLDDRPDQDAEESQQPWPPCAV